MSVYDYCISLSDGINWTRNWRKSDRKLKAHSFVFHADEINAILKEPLVLADGYLHTPTQPGLGIEIDEEALKTLTG